MSSSRQIFGEPTNNDPGKSMVEPRRFESLGHQKSSLASLWRRGQDEEGGTMLPASELPAIPSALEPKSALYSTPLPIPSMVVLSIVRARYPFQ